MRDQPEARQEKEGAAALVSNFNQLQEERVLTSQRPEDVEGPLNPSFCSGKVQDDAEVPTPGTTPKMNLRKGLLVGTWNILNLTEDHRLSHLSDELRKLKMDIVGLSETRRPGRGEISSGGYTYYWSGTRGGTCLKGVAIAISSQLQQFVVKVTPVNECVMQIRLKHTSGFISLTVVHAPAEECKAEEKEVFYAKLNSFLDKCPPWDIVVILGNFNASTGTERAGYEFCLGPNGSGTRNTNSSLFLNFAKSRRLRIGGSWYMRSGAHRWTWYGNAGEEPKEIDHILVNTLKKILENCRVRRTAEFFETDHKLVVATLKLPSKPRKKVKGPLSPPLKGPLSPTLKEPLSPPFCLEKIQDDAEVKPAPGPTLQLNLHKGLRIGTWNIRSLSDDHRVSHLSDELGKLKMDVVGLSETRRPGCGKISSGGFTYYWSGTRGGTCLRGVGVAISNILQPCVVEAYAINECMMQINLKHNDGFLCLFVVHAPAEECEAKEKNRFYSILEFFLDKCPPRGTVVVLGNFNACTGTERAGYEFCLGPNGSGTRNTNSSLFLNFAESNKLRIAGSFFKRSDAQRWTWYGNAGEEKEEIDHILVNIRRDFLNNCRVYRSAKFFETDHKIVVATLKSTPPPSAALRKRYLRFKSREKRHQKSV